MPGTRSTTSDGGRRPRHDPRETEREILDAAEQFLRERPWREVTVQAIMERTDLARPAFYVHFRDRHELALRVVDRIRAELLVEANRWFEGARLERRAARGARGRHSRLRRARPGPEGAVRRVRLRRAGRGGLPRADPGVRRRDGAAHPRGAGRGPLARARRAGDRPRPRLDGRGLPAGGARRPVRRRPRQGGRRARPDLERHALRLAVVPSGAAPRARERGVGPSRRRSG